ncbi:DUF881 domain-containing protein [Sporosalibacterium faouarense]|uniref:DUF881 domain-containing protein n=1 Tax=Sporosalibacterium faouarense TaxID=516123 RepID=UPI00141C0A73|nr:DUF881 domain-containing protein [Sporosalibacterium faouarense]MTI49039.1 DUF881 domain-containing protein [Bacillota bacterium]
MKSFRNKLALTLVCIILGIILAIQFKTVKKTFGEGDYIPTQRTEELILELEKLKDEKDTLRNELDKLETKVKQYEKGEADKNTYVENLYKELEKYRMLAGYEDVKGPGIILKIDDTKENYQYWDGSSAVVQNYDWILQMISTLNAAGAEAISINGQRYTSFTEIEAAGNHLMINGESSTTPVIIKAIGNPENLENALRMKGRIIWIITNEDYAIDIQIDKQENVEIPKYTKIREFRYATEAYDISN